VPTSQENSYACPRCGKVISPSEKHSCESTVASLPESNQTSQQERIVDCPVCKTFLDVSRFNPLENVTCVQCKNPFELLRTFGEYTLLKRYPTSWQDAVYLALHDDSGDLAIIKVLSAHVLAQPDVQQEFSEECKELTNFKKSELIKSVHSGQISGFQYFSVLMSPGVPDDALLDSLGIGLIGEQKDFGKVPVEVRTAHCIKCDKPIDVTKNNPLDRIFCPYCSQELELHRQFGSFRLDYKLSIGGSSVLYLAYAEHINKQVALKVLSAEEMLRNPNSVPMFHQESKLTQKLSHPNIVHVYESGEFGGFYYIALELVQGLTLDEIMRLIQSEESLANSKKWKGSIEFDGNKERFRPALPELICLEIMLQAAAGLGVAHENGLVHGDVKPENIMVTSEGVVKVLDFGLVQFANAEKLLAEGDPIYGTPLYIPPERVRGEPEDFRSDIYSLGATLYHLLRGIAPFVAKTSTEIAMKHTKSPLVSFKAYAPWVSEPTCRVVERSLKKTVNDRYRTHVEFIADLTLAKNQILNNLKEKHDGRTILKKFLHTLPRKKLGFISWLKSRTVGVLRSYKYVTKAITKRVSSKESK
jgi:serine/threonine protein kinase